VSEFDDLGERVTALYAEPVGLTAAVISPHRHRSMAPASSGRCAVTCPTVYHCLCWSERWPGDPFRLDRH